MVSGVNQLKCNSQIFVPQSKVAISVLRRESQSLQDYV